MKLLVIDQFSDLGGAQQQLCDLLPAFRERDWDATFAFPGAGELFRGVLQAGFRAERIVCGPFGNGCKSAADILRFLWQTPQLRRQLTQITREIQPDLIYCNGPRLLPALPEGIPIVFHAHSYLPSGASRQVAAAALRRRRARVIANCEFVAGCWREAVDSDRIAVIYNGVSGPGVSLRSYSRPVVGCVGRIAPQKGQLEFVAAAEAIHAVIAEVRFEIIGAPVFADSAASAYERRVREAAARLPVEFRGWVEGGGDALAGLDLLLAPSGPHEASTRVIPEAYAAGVPVVAFASGGIPEIVEHGVTGFLAQSTAEMARLALEVLLDPLLRTNLVRRGLERWRERFTLERYRSQALAFLEHAAAAGKEDRGIKQRRTSPAQPPQPASIHSRIG